MHLSLIEILSIGFTVVVVFKMIETLLDCIIYILKRKVNNKLRQKLTLKTKNSFKKKEQKK